MAEDAQGDLWLATDGGGVARWERRTETFQQFRHDPKQPQSLASDTVRTLLIDSKGLVWVGTKDHGLDILDPRTGMARHYRHRDSDAYSLPSDAIGALYADHEGRIWVGSDGGLSRYDSMADGFVTYGEAMSGAKIRDSRVRAIREDHNGALWIGTVNDGLARLDQSGSRFTVFRHEANDPHSLSHDHVWAVLEDDAKRLWVATADGLDLFDRNSQSFIRYGHDADNPQSLRDSDVMSLYQDRGGVLWVGTRAGGASHWNPRSWLLGHYFSEAFRGAQMESFAEDGAGKLWVGTIGGGLIEIDSRNGSERRYGADKPGAGNAALGRSSHGVAQRSAGLTVDRHHGRRTQPARSRQRQAARLSLDCRRCELRCRPTESCLCTKITRHTLGRHVPRRFGQHRSGDRQNHALSVWSGSGELAEQFEGQRNRRGHAGQSLDRHRRRRTQFIGAQIRPVLRLPSR